MPTLTIKNTPDDVVRRLRERARKHRRSLQGELLHIVEAAVMSRQQLSTQEFFDYVETLPWSTPSDSVQMIREDRDSR